MLIVSTMELMAFVVLAVVSLSSGETDFKKSVQETREVMNAEDEATNLKEDEKDEMIRRLKMALQKKTKKMNEVMKELKVFKEKTVENEELRERVYEQQRGKRLSNMTRAAGFNDGQFVKLKKSSKSYFLSKSKVTWEDAKTLCSQKGGELARLWNDEHQYVYDQIVALNIPQCITTASGYNCHVWLGGSAVNGKWTWYSGEPVTTQLSQWTSGGVSPTTPGNHLFAHEHLGDDTFHFEGNKETTHYNFLCQINSY